MLSEKSTCGPIENTYLSPLRQILSVPIDPTSPSCPPSPFRSSPRTCQESLASYWAETPASSVVFTLPTGAPTSDSLRLLAMLKLGPNEKPLLDTTAMLGPSSGALNLNSFVPR